MDAIIADHRIKQDKIEEKKQAVKARKKLQEQGNKIGRRTTRKDSKGRILQIGEVERWDGRYSFSYHDPQGNRKSVYSNRLLPEDPVPYGCRWKKALRTMEQELARDWIDGVGNFENLTVYEMAEKYISSRGGVKESTKQGYRTVLNILKADPFAKLKIENVRTSDAKEWFYKLQNEEGRGYSTIHNIRGVLRPAFQLAVEDDLIRKNPFNFPLGDIVKNNSKKREALSPEQEREFMDFVKSDPRFAKYHDAFYILLNTGLRISEFCGLTISDVDFEHKCINVSGQLVRRSDMELVYEETKTLSGVRVIPMSPEVAACFRSLWARRDPVTVEPIVGGKTGFICLDQYWNPKVALHWQHYCKEIVNKYNKTHEKKLPDISPHVFRHTFCSKMARAGMNPKSLQYIMGHSEFAVTMDIYAHIHFEDAQEEFMAVMDRVNEKGDDEL